MIVRTLEQLREVASVYATFPALAFDVETRGTRPQRRKANGDPDKNDQPALDTQTNEVTWIALAGPGRHDVIPMGHQRGEMLKPERKVKVQERDYNNLTKKGLPRLKTRQVTEPAVFSDPPEQLRPIDVFDALESVFFSSSRYLIGHNLKFDMKSIAKYYAGAVPAGPYFDTLVAQHIVNENVRRKGLKELTKIYFKYEYEDLGKVVDDVAFSRAAAYAGRDAKYTWLLFRELSARLTKKKLTHVMDLDMDVLGVLTHMELVGAPIDEVGRMRLNDDLTRQINACKGDLWRAAGEQWSVNSQPQQARFVYEICGHRAKQQTKGGKPSTAEDALEKIAVKDKRVQRLLDYKTLTKLHSTYVVGIGNAAAEGRVHANFTLHVAVTGRLTCTEPNLQNIPRPGEANATAIRGMFIAPPGHVLLVSDYGQQEYRVLAHFSQDPRYLDIFINHPEIDPHVMTAVELGFGDSPENVSKEDRTTAKNTGFAVVYGAGPDRVASMSGVSLSRAKEVMNRHQKTFPGIYKWIEHTKRDARTRVGPKAPPYVDTMLGRRRRLYEMRSPDRGLRGRAERQAVNFRIQGTSSEITKMAMVRYHQTAPREMPLILSVHDELVALCPQDQAEKGKEILEEAMVGAEMQALLTVPLTAEVKIVTRWSEAK